jgi:hypothetical protein
VEEHAYTPHRERLDGDVMHMDTVKVLKRRLGIAEGPHDA